MSRKNSVESFERFFRKKVKSVSMLDTDSEIILQPEPGREFVVTDAFLRVSKAVGENSDAPAIILDNGTNGNDIVQAVDTLVTEGAVQRLTVAGNYVVNYDNPLRLRKTDAAGGSTTLNVDLIFGLLEISS